MPPVTRPRPLPGYLGKGRDQFWLVACFPGKIPIIKLETAQRLLEHEDRQAVGVYSRPAPMGRGSPYRGTSLIRNRPHLGPYSRPMPRALRWS